MNGYRTKYTEPGKYVCNDYNLSRKKEESKTEDCVIIMIKLWLRKKMSKFYLLHFFHSCRGIGLWNWNTTYMYWLVLLSCFPPPLLFYYMGRLSGQRKIEGYIQK